MRFIIVGGGAAGMNAASVLRKKMEDSSIDIFSDEQHPFYSRPRLIEVLARQSAMEQIYSHPQGWYEANRISFHMGTSVSGIDVAAHRISLERGSTVEYDKLLLATGALARRLPIEGSQKQGVFTLRTAADCLAIRDFAEGRKRAVLIGGGWLGLESARSLRTLGLEVTVLEVAERLLPRQLDGEGAALLLQMIENFGINVRLGAHVAKIEGADSVSSVSLGDGSEIPADLVLVVAGVVPNAKLAKDSGIEVKSGIMVDQFMQTSVLDVFAAGDCAEWQGKSFGIIPAALEQSSVAAANMAAPGSVEYRGTVPANTLKVAGIDLTSVGVAVPEKEQDYTVLRRIDSEARVYKKTVLKDDFLVGFILVGTTKSAAALTSLVKEKKRVGDIESLLA